jgi:LysM repeat protein
MSTMTLSPAPVRSASARPAPGPATPAGRRAHAPAAADARSAPGALRLTRRGRLVAFLTFLAAALALLVFAVSDAATGSGERGRPVPVTMVQVESGDTLWSIATRAAPGEDPRGLIDRIQQLNALEGPLQVGTRIAVPVRP